VDELALLRLRLEAAEKLLEEATQNIEEKTALMERLVSEYNELIEKINNIRDAFLDLNPDALEAFNDPELIELYLKIEKLEPDLTKIH